MVDQAPLILGWLSVTSKCTALAKAAGEAASGQEEAVRPRSALTIALTQQSNFSRTYELRSRAMDFVSEDGVIKLHGQRFHLKGLNWFGFETDLCNLHGLWSVSLEKLLDFCASHRFNALRVPFSCELVSQFDSRHPGGMNDHANPDLKGATSRQVSLKCSQQNGSTALRNSFQPPCCE